MVDQFNESSFDFRAIVQRAQDGDDEALGELFQLHRNYLLTIANKELDTDLAGKLGPSDVVQRSLISAHQLFRQFSGTTSAELRAWLRQFVLNDLKDARRTYKGTKKREIKREHSLNLHSSREHPLVDPQTTPQTGAINSESLARLKENLGKLSIEYQQVIQLHTFQKMSFKEAGLEMSRSADATQKLWTRAILKLKTLVN